MRGLVTVWPFIQLVFFFFNSFLTPFWGISHELHAMECVASLQELNSKLEEEEEIKKKEEK